jgi:hypothetical protein
MTVLSAGTYNVIMEDGRIKFKDSIVVSRDEAIRFVENALHAIKEILAAVRLGIEIKEKQRSFWSKLFNPKDTGPIVRVEKIQAEFNKFLVLAKNNTTDEIRISSYVWDSGHTWIDEYQSLFKNSETGPFR